MSVLDRSALVESPLADLHTIASELSIDGYRRLRRDELVDAIIEKQGGEEPAEESPAPARRRRSRRGSSAADAGETEQAPATDEQAKTEDEAEEAPKPRRSRSRSRKADTDQAPKAEAPADEEKPAAEKPGDGKPADEKPARSRRGRAKVSEERAEPAEPTASDEETIEGSVEVLPNGSGFVRFGGSADDDVYISSAQVKRCELVSGDPVSGPKRAPRRSERFASLIRIETINGRPASEQADTVRFDDLPSALPTELIDLSGADAELKAIQALAPIGRGSRVTITGAARSGKSELLRRIAAALTGQDGLTLSVALAGVRPEEVGGWSADGEPAVPAPAAALSFGASEDARAGALEAVVDQARRLAARGSHVVVLIDTLDGLGAHAVRKLTASARNLTDGGSVTIIATAAVPVGGETTVIALDPAAAAAGRFAVIDALASGTLRPERLVGESAAKKIARDRAKALKD